MPQHHRSDKLPHLYDRALMLHGSRRNEVLTPAEVKRYGLDSFADADYISIYGMPPEEWYRHGIRVLGRTAVECTVMHSAIVLASMLLRLPNVCQQITSW
jgi:hypothetical protein